VWAMKLNKWQRIAIAGGCALVAMRLLSGSIIEHYDHAEGHRRWTLDPQPKTLPQHIAGIVVLTAGVVIFVGGKTAGK